MRASSLLAPSLFCLALAGMSCSAKAEALPTASSTASNVCDGLQGRAIPDLTIVSAEPVAAQAGAPAYCRVRAAIDREIGVELRLPERAAWNGRFLAAGVGGQAGQVNSVEIGRAVRRGYAAASTDAGHTVSDRHWLLGGPQRAENYAWRANHLLAEKGKALTAAFYGRAADHAFFVGCSGGGRQALTEVERFPNDYDGVIAGAPGVNTPEMSGRRMWEMVQHSRYAGVMSQADWTHIAAAAVDACDAQDGVRDGVINDPRTCRFKPRDIACGPKPVKGCLSPAQVALAERIYAPLRDENGRKVDDGLLPGVPVEPVLAPEPYTPGPPYLAVALFGDGVHKDVNWDAKTFRLADDLPAIDRVMNLHADNPDLSGFNARSGKLILFQGWADPLVSAGPTIDWFRAVEARMGGAKATRGFARLFMVPGMGHCRGGNATDQFGGLGADGSPVDPDHDMLSALEAWVAGGPGPERITAAKLEAGKAIRTRPLCAWPKQAAYDGRGDQTRAESFTCRTSRP